MIRFKEITGVAGVLKAGPHVAAELGDWSITPQNGSFAFSAAVKTVNEFWMSQTPHDLRLPFGKNGVVWRAVNLVFAEGRVSGTLPLLEES